MQLNNNLTSSLGRNKLIYNESEDAYYIQHCADSALKKLGNSYAPLQVYWESSASQYLSIPVNGHDIKVTFLGTSATTRENLRFYGSNEIHDITNATQLDSSIATSTVSTFFVKQYKYLICRTGTRTRLTFNTLVEWV